MGQFTARPEEPAEWAGLPSEPMEARPAAESLAAPIGSADPLTFLGDATESVEIPLPPADLPPTPSGTGDGDPAS